MPECSICRRQFDGRFQVFVPPHGEPFDTIECARRAAGAWTADMAPPVPVLLPTIEAVRPRARTPAAPAPARRSLAALTALALTPSQVALAGGVGLLAAGTAASVYLAARPSGNAPVAAELPTTGPITRPPAVRPAEQTLPQTEVSRPPDATARRSVTGPKRATRVVPRPAIDVAAPTSGSNGGVSESRDQAPQLISRPVPTVQPTRAAPSPAQTAPEPKPKPKPTGTRKPKPVPPAPKPPAKPAPAPAPEPAPAPAPAPAPEAEPANPPPAEPPVGEGGGAGPIATAAAVSAPVVVQPSSEPPSEPSPPAAEPPTSQPPAAEPPTDGPPAKPPPSQPGDKPAYRDSDRDSDRDCERDERSDNEHRGYGDHDRRPGNGWGDENHDHSGPPGRSGDDHDNGKRHGGGGRDHGH